MRCSSSTAAPVATSSSVHARSPRPRALASTDWVSLVEVDLGGDEEVGAPALGQQDQVADQARHPVDLVEQQLAGLRALDRIARVEQLEVAAQHGQRRPELVAGVVEELALVARSLRRGARAWR